MNERTWINEALQLRFDKKVKLEQIRRKVDVPRTVLSKKQRQSYTAGP
jgi:transposase